MTTTTLLLTMPLAVHAFFFSTPYDVFDWHVPTTYSARSYEVAPRPTTTSSWLSTKDHYVMRLRVPDLEPESVEATLQADEAFLTLSAKKKYEGCSCDKRVVESVPLPYRPRAEDIEIELHDRSNILELRLARKAKATAPIALSVKLAGQQPQEAAVEETRKIRFIPHASATDGDETKVATNTEKKKSVALEERERSLTAKFAAALSTSSKAAKEAEAATNEETTAHAAAEATAMGGKEAASATATTAGPAEGEA